MVMGVSARAWDVYSTVQWVMLWRQVSCGEKQRPQSLCVVTVGGAAYCSTKRFTPYSFLARSMKSFMMVLASKTGGEMRYTAVIGEVFVAVMKGLDHVVRSSQSNLTVGWTVAAVAEDADREAMRKGVDEVWHSLAMHEPTLPVPPVMSIVPFGEGDMVKVVRHRVVDAALLRVLVVIRGLTPIYIELHLACSG